MMFAIHINNIGLIFKTFKPILYADDTNFFYKAKGINSKIDLTNSNLRALVIWRSKNKLTINIEKTCYIILKNSQNTFQFRHDRFKLKDSNLTYANEVKFLGVILEHLNCHAHINFF